MLQTQEFITLAQLFELKMRFAALSKCFVAGLPRLVLAPIEMVLNVLRNCVADLNPVICSVSDLQNVKLEKDFGGQLKAFFDFVQI